MLDKIKPILEEQIAKHLPAEMGTILKERLESIEETEKKLESALQTIQNKDKEIKLCNDRITEYSKKESFMIQKDEDLRKKEIDLNNRDKAITDRELKAEVTEYKYKMEEANKRADIVMNYTSVLVKNPVLKESTFKHESGMTMWDHNVNANRFVPDGNGSSETKTKEVE